MPTRKYKATFYRGKISPKTRVESFKFKAVDDPHARQFAKMRRSNLIAVIELVKEKP